ncbi:MAG TPA: HIT family protein [Lachnospiraceae bacterium]|nr:HIT family protein [Lachnospiraceae bacterium]
MRDENCIFCKILDGKIPSTTVYEDDSFKAILDAGPAARGHVIILPKNHAANLFELPDEDASKIMVVAKKIAIAIKETYHCDGVNVLQNNGEAAGQSVFHLHVHVIPRFKGDTDTINIGWRPGDMPDDMDAIADEIKANL